MASVYLGMKKACLIYLLAGIFLCVINIKNSALFYHHTSLYTDSNVQISLLNSFKLIPRIFTNDLSLYTNGEYRPIDFLFLSLLKNTLNGYFSPKALHIVLIFIQLINAVLFFLITKEFIPKTPSLLLSLLFLLNPFSITFINDPNFISVPLGLLFIFLCFFFYIQYLNSRKKYLFAISLLCFTLSIFTSSLAIFVPVFIGLIYHIGFRYGKLALGVVIYFAILIFFLSLKFNIYLLMASSMIFLFIFLIGEAGRYKKEIIYLSVHLSLFLAVIVIWYITCSYIGVKPVFKYPLYQLRLSHALAPFSVKYVWSSILGNKYLLFIASFFLFPFLLGNYKWQNVILGLFLLIFFIFSIKTSFIYKNDLIYWKNMASQKKDDPAVQVNLAQAQIASGRLEEAKEVLYDLLYQKDKIPALIKDTVYTELGFLYHKLGKIKISAYYFLQKTKGALPGASKIAKWRLIPVGDFLFDLGYLSYAENYYASALVLDPYDINVYKKLGKVLVYKNFFRASLRYFDRVLRFNPKDKETLLYAMFSSKTIGDEEKLEHYKKLWKMASDQRPDFSVIYKKFNSYSRDIRKYLSEDPIVLFFTGETKKRFVYSLNGKEYKFWEVPFEVGKYFYRKKRYEPAIVFLSYAYDLSKNKEVKTYLKMAQEKNMIPTKEEIMRAIKEQEMIERMMEKRKKGGRSF